MIDNFSARYKTDNIALCENNYIFTTLNSVDVKI